MMCRAIPDYIAAASRSVLLACAPVSVSGVLQAIEQRCGVGVARSFYWLDRDRPGVLLVECASSMRAAGRLSQLPGFARSVVSRGPAFRVCSDRLRWPAAVGADTHVDELQRLHPTLQLQKSTHLSRRVLLSQLAACASVDEQVALLFKQTRPSYADLLARFVLSDSVEEVLCHYRPGTKVRAFGSAANGLGSSNSDLDIVIKLGAEINPDLRSMLDTPHAVTDDSSSNSHSGYKKTRLLGRLSKTTLGNPSSLLLSSNEQLQPIFLSVLRHLLNRLDPVGFKRAKIFPALIPILHVPKVDVLGVGLDVSCAFNNCHSVHQNQYHDGILMAELLRLLGSCVRELHTCIVTLKFIARRAEITRVGPSPGWTNFKLTALFIHFLQVHGYAPTFEQLLCWNRSSHSVPPDNIFPPLPSMTPLLQRFCEYIPTLNPANSIISLRHGCVLPRTSCSAQLESSSHPSDAAADGGGGDCGSVIDLSMTDQNYLVCPNPVRPCQNVLRGVTEAKWFALVHLCEHWRTHALRHNTTPATTPWGLLALQPVQPPRLASGEAQTSSSIACA